MYNLKQFLKLILLCCCFHLLLLTNIAGQDVDTLYQGGTAIELIGIKPNEIIIGSDEGIAKSTDYGSSWINASFDEQPPWIDDISFNQTNTNIGFAAGGSKLYKTSDGGLSWNSVDTLEKIYLVDVNPYNSNIVFAQKAEDTFGGPFLLLRSFDSGVTWESIEISGFIRDMNFSSTNDSLVFGRYDFDILQSIDIGNSWESIKKPSNQGSNFSALSVEKEFLYASESGLLFESTDNGNDWESIGSGLLSYSTTYYIRAILQDPSNSNRIYVALKEGIYFTEDGGENWQNVIKLNSIAHFIKADHNSPRNIYILGSELVRIVDTVAVTNISEDFISKPTGYVLNQNYPNPFNPITHLSYSLPEKALVSLKIYDLLGREVAELVNEYKDSGSYSVEFNGSDTANGVNLASGMYIVSMQAGEFKQSKKILLMK